MRLDKIVKRAAKAYQKTYLDKLAGKAEQLFDEFVPEKTKNNKVVKNLKGMADDIIQPQSNNQQDNPLADNIRKGINRARKIADKYAEDIVENNGQQTNQDIKHVQDNLKEGAEKFSDTIFNKKRR